MNELLELHVSVLELIVRGSAVYWFLFLLFRFVLRRDVGQLGVADVLLLVLVADASQNAMSGGYTTVAEGFILVATIASWNLLLDALAFRFKAIARIVEPPALLLVRDGRLIRATMRKQFITEDDVLSKLREKGIDSYAEVRRGYLEGDGQISVLLKKPSARRVQDDPARPATR
jgi:uncharacterized membrane protein YcaP (DUF421 family)